MAPATALSAAIATIRPSSTSPRWSIRARVRAVPWVESHSLSFSARHDSQHAGQAAAVLESLEAFRDELSQLFDRTPGEVSVVIHPRPSMLAFAPPWLPLARMVAAPASRRYFAGWFSREEIHVLAQA